MSAEWLGVQEGSALKLISLVPVAASESIRGVAAPGMPKLLSCDLRQESNVFGRARAYRLVAALGCVKRYRLLSEALRIHLSFWMR